MSTTPKTDAAEAEFQYPRYYDILDAMRKLEESLNSPTPTSDAMERIQYEGCTCIVAAPEDIEAIERQRNAALARVRVLETTLGRLINQCDETDWMGSEIDAVLDNSRKALQP